MKLVKLITGEEIKGDIIEDNEDSVTVRMALGQLTVKKSNIASSVNILDCTTINVGQFIQTPRGVYLKIDEGTYRLVKGPYTSQIDTPSIEDGSVIGYEEVFPSKEEVVEAEGPE